MYYLLVFLAGLVVGAVFHEYVKEGFRLLFVGIILAVGFLVDLFRLAWHWMRYLWLRIREKWAPRLDTLRKKLIVLAVVLFYVILAILGVMLLLAMGAGWVLVGLFIVAAIALLVAFLLSDIWGQIIALVAWLLLMAGLVWKAVTQFFSGFGSMLAELAGWIGSLLGDLLKSVAAGLTALSISLPSCGTKQEPQAPAPVVTPVPQRFAVGVPLSREMRVIASVTVRPKEGCLRITDRGGMGLTLRECRDLTEEYDRKVERKGRFTLAPNIHRGETWTLVEQGGSRKWIIPVPPRKR